MIFGFAVDYRHQRRVAVDFAFVADRVDAAQRIRTAFDVRVTPDFLRERTKVSLETSRTLSVGLPCATILNIGETILFGRVSRRGSAASVRNCFEFRSRLSSPDVGWRD